jgi:hypothetical protein
MHPWETFGSDFDREFLEKARFACKICGKDCKLEEGRLEADSEKDKMFAFGRCSECHSELKFDVTHIWREE